MLLCEEKMGLVKFWEENQAALIRTAMRVLRNKEEAEDVVSDVMVRLMERAPGLRISNVRGYAFASVKNRAIDCYRKRKMEEKFIQEPVYQEVCISPDADYEVLSRIHYNDLIKAVDSLVPKQRRVVLARLVREEPYSKIARQEGITEGCARKRVQHARERLQRRLNEWNLGAA